MTLEKLTYDMSVNWTKIMDNGSMLNFISSPAVLQADRLDKSDMAHELERFDETMRKKSKSAKNPVLLSVCWLANGQRVLFLMKMWIIS